MRIQLRPVLAAVLALLFPGLGHLLLRRWGRALLWHLTIIGGGVALLILYGVDVDGIDAPTEAAAALPTDVALPLALLYALSALDAYLVGQAAIAEKEQAAATEAIRRRTTNDDASGDNARNTDAAGQMTATSAATSGTEAITNGEPATVDCPNCGKETDADIDFCHWCTEPLPWAASEE